MLVSRYVMGLILILVLVPTHASSTLVNEPAITLTLDPRYGYELLDIQATLRIDPHYENYEACLEWESKDLGPNRGCWSLTGQYDRKLHVYTIHKLPAGDYRIFASVNRVRSSFVTPTQSVRVIESPFR